MQSIFFVYELHCSGTNATRRSHVIAMDSLSLLIVFIFLSRKSTSTTAVGHAWPQAQSLEVTMWTCWQTWSSCLHSMMLIHPFPSIPLRHPQTFAHPRSLMPAGPSPHPLPPCPLRPYHPHTSAHPRSLITTGPFFHL